MDTITKRDLEIVKEIEVELQKVNQRSHEMAILDNNPDSLEVSIYSAENRVSMPLCLSPACKKLIAEAIAGDLLRSINQTKERAKKLKGELLK